MNRLHIAKTGLILVSVFAGYNMSAQDKDAKWVAPANADKLENNYTTDDDIQAGSDSYAMYCAVCHGDNGKGDGPGGVSLPIKPRDFTSKDVKDQSDGALFWKLSNGRGNMVAYGLILAEEERWQLVSYIKSLNEN